MMQLKIFHADGDHSAYTKVEKQVAQFCSEHGLTAENIVSATPVTREDRGRHHVSYSILFYIPNGQSKA